MFYITKFAESLIFPPGIFIVLFVSTSVFTFHHQKLIAVIGLLISGLLYACSTTLVADTLIRPLENAFKPPVNLTGDVLVMLGGGATYGTPGVSGEGNLTGDGANRLLTTVMLYHKTHLPFF